MKNTTIALTELTLLRQLIQVGQEMRVCQKLAVHYKSCSALHQARRSESQFDALLQQLAKVSAKPMPRPRKSLRKIA
jgi:hypothetical protein